MTADIGAVLSRLRERPECRDAVEVIERLTAERDRLRERMAKALDHCIGWHGSCCPCDGGPDGDEPCMDDLLGESPVPTEPRELSEVEHLRAALAHQTGLLHGARETLHGYAYRIDEHVFGELACYLDDEALDGDGEPFPASPVPDEPTPCRTCGGSGVVEAEGMEGWCPHCPSASHPTGEERGR